MIYPEKWAKQWVDAWNLEDTVALLSMYAPNIQLRSPFAKLYAPNGVIAGKTALEEYWKELLRRNPETKLEIIETFVGHQALSIHYCDHIGRSKREVIETFLFNDKDEVVFETACLGRTR